VFLFVIKEILILLFGTVCSVFLTIAIILSVPIYIYRFLITLLAKKLHPKTLGKAVTSFGNYFACEFLPSSINKPPRSAVVVSFVVDGHISIEGARALFKRRWFNSESNNSDEGLSCRYPELQQYVVSWMGFLFWKQDLEFQLENHLKPHTLEGESDAEVEDNLCYFMEELLNKPFALHRSPWECYIISKYRNSTFAKECVNTDSEGMTLVVFRFHHSIADGLSILYAIIEALLDTPLTTISLPSPSAKRVGVLELMKNVVHWLTVPFRFIYDVSHFFACVFSRTSPWHVPDEKKSYRQCMHRSPPIPIEYIKDIKNNLGVSFAGVLLSSVCAGIAQTLHPEKGPGYSSSKTLLTSAPLPRPGHPNKMRNHMKIISFNGF